MAYPGLVLANAALMEGIDVTMFFTFWGLDMITKRRMNSLKCYAHGQPLDGYAQWHGYPKCYGYLAWDDRFRYFDDEERNRQAGLSAHR